jgi:2-polyprenyl-6-methoxyphenol hydroxylase-like FAD-dependent oxidoreductase
MTDSLSAMFARLSDPEPPAVTPVLMDTAVVLGGSVAGLLAARVLSDHAASVIVIDKDTACADTGPRPGVPHGAHVHALLPGGLVQLERWFPGFGEQALAAGARPAPPSARRVYLGGVQLPPGSRAPSLCGTRPFLEAQIRRRTLTLPNVQAITGRVTGLEFGSRTVTGVRYESSGEPHLRHADFAVDAMGRSSRLSRWLEQGGWQRPLAQRMGAEISYATALLPRRDGDPGVSAVIWRPLNPAAGVRGAVLNQVEGDRWMAMISGYAGSRPGQTPEDFIRLCRSVLPPEFAAVTEQREITSGVATYRYTGSMRRDFSALAGMPARLVAMGDAVASFNPVYGQGMTAAALQASALSQYLRSRPDLSKPASEFFRLQKVVVDAAWRVSVSADRVMARTSGSSPLVSRLRQRIVTQVLEAAARDPEIARPIEEIGYMLRHPRSLPVAGTAARVIRASLQARHRR